MDKFTAIWALLREGQSVADPKLWKERQINGTLLAGVLMAVFNVLAAFGMPLPVTPEMANLAAGAIVSVWNLVLTVTTSDKVGLPPKG